MKNIEHVFFDLDRTLWDFETNSRVTLEELFAEYQLADRTNTTADLFIAEYKRINEIFWKDYRVGAVSKEGLRFARFEVALAYFGVKDKGLAAKIGQDYIDRSPHKNAVVDGAFDLLEHLKPKYKLHIITNGFVEVQQIKLSMSGIAPYFDQIIISELVGHNKPSTEVFRFAENASGSSPMNSVMIGDHYEADVTGALNAGWKAVYFEPEEVDFEPDPKCIRIRSLRELIGML